MTLFVKCDGRGLNRLALCAIVLAVLGIVLSFCNRALESEYMTVEVPRMPVTADGRTPVELILTALREISLQEITEEAGDGETGMRSVEDRGGLGEADQGEAGAVGDGAPAGGTARGATGILSAGQVRAVRDGRNGT